MEATFLGLPKLCLPAVWEVLPDRKVVNGSCQEAGDGPQGKFGLATLGRGWAGEPTFGKQVGLEGAGEPVEVCFTQLIFACRGTPSLGSCRRLQTRPETAQVCEAVLKQIKPV